MIEFLTVLTLLCLLVATDGDPYTSDPPAK